LIIQIGQLITVLTYKKLLNHSGVRSHSVFA